MLFTWRLVTLRSTRPLTGTNVLVNVAPLAGCSMARIGGPVIPAAGAWDWMVRLTPVVLPAAPRPSITTRVEPGLTPTGALEAPPADRGECPQNSRPGDTRPAIPS